MVVKKKVAADSPSKKGRFAELKAKIKPVSELPLFISALFYGRSGSGKTTVAASFPKPALLIDISEQGTDSIFDVEGVDVIQITTWDEFEEIYWMLKKEGDYKTVILDQVTTLQDLCQRTVLEEESSNGKMSLRLFGEVSSRMKTWILSYRDLVLEGIHVVFLAHDRTFGDDDGDEDNQIEPTVGPRLMPSVAAMIAGAVKIVGCTFIQEKLGEKKPNQKTRERTVRYCMRLGAHGTYTTKLRTSKNNPVPRVVANPTYEALVAIMRHDGSSSDEEDQPPSAVKRRIKRS